jgi:hypothetical protein
MIARPFVWPLGGGTEPDEMNTSFGPRIDDDRWDFHDGIDLPARVGTPVRAMADGTVFSAGPADEVSGGDGYRSTHVVIKVKDPPHEAELYLVYIHLLAIAETVIPGAPVEQGDIIGLVGEEAAKYPHLHFEFRKGGPEERKSVHPLSYLPHPQRETFKYLRLDGCNFYERGGPKRAVRLRFELLERRQGDLQKVEVELRGEGVAPHRLCFDFDKREPDAGGQGEDAKFTGDIAVEGYQKSNLKRDRVSDLQYGVLLRNIAPEYNRVHLSVSGVRSLKPKHAELSLPVLGHEQKPIQTLALFDGPTFPPQGWTDVAAPGNTCRPDERAPGVRALLCEDRKSSSRQLLRAGLRFELPERGDARPTFWRLEAELFPSDLGLPRGTVIYPLAFVHGDELVAAACLRRLHDGRLIAGVAIRSQDRFLKEKIDVVEGEVSTTEPYTWEVELLRLGTRQPTAILRFTTARGEGRVVARINGDATTRQPDAACAGLMHRLSHRHMVLHLDRLLLSEAPRSTS